jgi:CCR4-NOT transcription complex subunit 9
MANPPPYFSAGPYSAPAPAAKDQDAAKEDQDVAQLVLDLCVPELREKALLFLSKVNDRSLSRRHCVCGG